VAASSRAFLGEPLLQPARLPTPCQPSTSRKQFHPSALRLRQIVAAGREDLFGFRLFSSSRPCQGLAAAAQPDFDANKGGLISDLLPGIRHSPG